MVKVTKIKGTRAELLAKLYEMMAKESGTSVCRLFFIRQARDSRKDCKEEKVIVGVFRKLT